MRDVRPFSLAGATRQGHEHSLSESTFNMIKAKFGGRIRCKIETAQVNELLCKVLCHNICCLIQSFFELGVEPTFEADSAVASKVPS